MPGRKLNNAVFNPNYSPVGPTWLIKHSKKMKKLLLITILLIGLTGCSSQPPFGAATIDNLKLKATEDKIIDSQTFTETEYQKDTDGKILLDENKNPIVASTKQIVAYSYKSDEIAPALDNEIIEKRTENIVTRNLGGNKRSAQSGYNFYKEGNNWKQVKFATTTPEVFNKETPISWLINKVWAANTAATSPGTAADDAAIGSIAWLGINSIKVADTSYAYASIISGSPSHYAKATNFGFAIPTGATIDGIIAEARVGVTDGLGTTQDNAVRIVKADGTIGATDKSNTTQWASLAYLSHGGATDKWGETWTEADIEDVDFGFALSAKNNDTEDGDMAKIEHVRMTVYYTEGGSNTCTYSGTGNWNVLGSDACYITSDVYVNGEFNLIGGSFGCADGVKISATKFNFGIPTNMEAECMAWHQ